MNPEADGTMSTPVPEDKEYVEQVNAVSKTIMGGIAELIRFMKQHIFHDGQIKSQELVISEDGKLLSLCDLSNEKAVVEIKTANVIRKDEEFGDRLDYLPAYQLYYQAKGRSTFLLQINYSLGIDVIEDSIKQVVSGLTFVLYSVSFREAKDGELSPHLGSDSLAAKILEALMGNGHLTIDELKKQFGCGRNAIQRAIDWLKTYQFIERVGLRNQYGYWKVLKDRHGKPYEMKGL